MAVATIRFSSRRCSMRAIRAATYLNAGTWTDRWSGERISARSTGRTNAGATAGVGDARLHPSRGTFTVR
jgi:hypothetical protein